jgi:hypothetical protein
MIRHLDLSVKGCISSVDNHFRGKNWQKIYITVFKNNVADGIYEWLFMRYYCGAGTQHWGVPREDLDSLSNR